MSTRANYTFKDEHDTLHVYKHCDGYPSSAVEWIRKAIGYAWPLPRFEADDFGAAFIAANKPRGGGNVRLMQSGEWLDVTSSDVEFHYEITLAHFPGHGEDARLWVRAYKIRVASNDLKQTEIFSGPLSEMASWAAKYEAEKA